MNEPPADQPTDAPIRTTKYLLVEARLGSSLADYLRTARRAGDVFHNMAFDLTAKTGVPLTHEVVRRWVRTLEMEAGEEPSVLPGHEHHSLTSFDEEKPAAA